MVEKVMGIHRKEGDVVLTVRRRHWTREVDSTVSEADEERRRPA